MNPNQLQIFFHGGTGEVTGANFLGVTDQGQFLVDCGMVQGGEEYDMKNWEDFPYDVSAVDVLFVTHAHQDHIGRIPKLIRDGFRGKIYSTAPTKDLSAIMLEDALSIMEQDAHRLQQEPLYTKEDIQTALSLWKTVLYHNVTEFLPGWSFEFKDAGHVLGSAMIRISHHDTSILFTGDLGNSPNVVLPDSEVVDDVDYVVMESVYGDRNHEHRDDRTKLLERAIEDIAYRKGTLVIPSFSLERTQELLFELNEFIEHGRVPKISVYLDSPLAIQVTEQYRHYHEFLNTALRERFKKGDDPFSFPHLYYTPTSDDSKEINTAHSPKIIIAGSGMMNGGRVLHHALRYLPDEKSMILFVGYQAAGTLGRIISDGAHKVRIFGNEVPVRAEIRHISGYSGHAGSDELVTFIEQKKPRVKKVFCVMGETKSALFLVQRLRDYLGVSATAPQSGDSVILEFPSPSEKK